MRTSKLLFILFLALFAVVQTNAQELRPEIKLQVQEQIENLRTAHLNSDVDLADKLYHPDLILTSQSGKKYNKEVALKNLENTFEYYENSDITFLPISENVVLTNYINERKYKDFDKGTYRLTVVWTKHRGKWRIISMQSSKVKQRKK
ncbi:nuclear transport factor 2 family protein [uncultured Croceitalea sp.]|uniref:nuclear transport factor 2 family protein n=1 Tax=uncultured Croceitalea sp. TaxID=1798908 RepID=UPI003305850F